MTAPTDLLAEHQYRAYEPMSSCTCGAPTPRFYRAHLATVIEAHYATELDRARAEVLEDAADAMGGHCLDNEYISAAWLRDRAATYRTNRED